MFLNYTIKNIFEEGLGKFSVIFGNAAIIDCNYVFIDIIDGAFEALKQIQTLFPSLYNKAVDLLNRLTQELASKGITLCDYTYSVNGVLKDQASYYLGSYEDIQRGIVMKAENIVDVVGTQANMTITAPLE